MRRHSLDRSWTEPGFLESMARVNKKGRSKFRTFVMLRHDVTGSPAFLSLSPVAVAVLIQVRRRYNGSNNGEIPLSVREAAGLVNVSPDTAGRAFKELVAKGFLVSTRKSTFANKKMSRRWRLTDEATETELPTNEWRTWKPPKNSFPSPTTRTLRPSHRTVVQFPAQKTGP